STFNNYDYECDRIVIAPHSPCPILFGIRGDDPGVLPAALQTIKGESPAGWIVFETNQGTDDHVIPAPTLEPRTTVQVDTQVLGLPRTIRGGHVVLEMNGLEAVAYEPSQGFRNIVRALRPGDRVRVVGSIPRPGIRNRRSSAWTTNESVTVMARKITVTIAKISKTSPAKPSCCAR